MSLSSLGPGVCSSVKLALLIPRVSFSSKILRPSLKQRTCFLFRYLWGGGIGSGSRPSQNERLSVFGSHGVLCRLATAGYQTHNQENDSFLPAQDGPTGVILTSLPWIRQPGQKRGDRVGANHCTSRILSPRADHSTSSAPDPRRLDLGNSLRGWFQST